MYPVALLTAFILVVQNITKYLLLKLARQKPQMVDVLNMNMFVYCHCSCLKLLTSNQDI